MTLKQRKAPNTYFLLFAFIIVMAALTWIIPGGQYKVDTVDGRESVIPGTFQYVDSNPQGPDQILKAPVKGFIDAALIISLILIVGGAFAVFQKTQAVDAAIRAVASAYKRSSLVRVLLIPILMTMFSMAGAIFGMSEEVIPFILIFIPLALALGYDSITGVAIPFLGAGAGFAGAFLNPFTIGIAQEIAGLNLFSGIEYRILTWIIITAVTIIYVSVYAKRIKKNPQISPTFEMDEEKRFRYMEIHMQDHNTLTNRHKWVLFTFLSGILILIFGVLKYQWFIEEISALFLITGIAVGLVARLTVNEITGAFVNGARDLVGTAIVVALARGILIIAKEGLIIDTILNTLSGTIAGFHPVLSAQLMFIVQTILNFFIPSGSGQAALTMPIMAPLADLVNVSRQTAVLAFQFGDGFSNMIIPTSAVTMGVLTLSEIPWERWARWLIPLEILYLIVGFILLVPPVMRHW